MTSAREIAKYKSIIVRETQKEIERKGSIMVPSFFQRMRDEYDIPYEVAFASFKADGLIHPDVDYHDFMRRNGF